MKKSTMILWIIFIASFISTAFLLGKVYSNGVQTYKNAKTMKLNTEDLKSINIYSDIPIEVATTFGEPYIEISQTYKYLIGEAPVANLIVQQKEGKTQIKVDTDDTDIFSLDTLGYSSNREAVVKVYLPEHIDIDTLKVETPDRRYDNTTQAFFGALKVKMNISDSKIKNINVEAEQIFANLDGSFQKIQLHHNGYEYGECEIVNNEEADVNIDQMENASLSGKFNLLEISNANNLKLDSIYTKSLSLTSNKRVKSILKGDYKDVAIKIYDDSTLDSDGSLNILNLKLYALYSNVNLSGAINSISFNGDFSNIAIKNAMIPNKIDISEDCEGNAYKFTLPNNISGLMVDTCVKIADENPDAKNLDNEDFNIISDFPLKPQLVHDKVNFAYGDEGIKILINNSLENSLEIVDGGYISSDLEEAVKNNANDETDIGEIATDEEGNIEQ